MQAVASRASGAERARAVVHLHVERMPDVLEPVPATTGSHVFLWAHGLPYAALLLSTQQLPVPARELLEQFPVPSLPAPPDPRLAGACTVVVCTRDRPEVLDRCLTSLDGLDRRPASVLVVDNAARSSAATREVVRAHPAAHYLAQPRPGLSAARNLGWQASPTEFVAYTDDDVVVEPGWLDRLLAPFSDPQVQASTGLVLPLAEQTRAQQVFESHWSFSRGFVARSFGPDFYLRTSRSGCPAWDVGAGASTAFRRDCFLRLGGFDERLGAGAAGCSEDSEMWYRIMATGGTCQYSPESVAHHEHRRTDDALRRQLRAYLRGHVTALVVQYVRHGDTGNLRRLTVHLPAHYARLTLRRLRRGPDDDRTSTLGAEVAGAIEGLLLCLRDPVTRREAVRRTRRLPA